MKRIIAAIMTVAVLMSGMTVEALQHPMRRSWISLLHGNGGEQ